MNKINNSRKKLFDGLENIIEKEKFQLKEINFSINDIVKNSIKDLKTQISNYDFKKIIEDLNIEEDNNMFVSYKSLDGLKIYFIKKIMS